MPSDKPEAQTVAMPLGHEFGVCYHEYRCPWFVVNPHDRCHVLWNGETCGQPRAAHLPAKPAEAFPHLCGALCDGPRGCIEPGAPQETTPANWKDRAAAEFPGGWFCHDEECFHSPEQHGPHGCRYCDCETVGPKSETAPAQRRDSDEGHIVPQLATPAPSETQTAAGGAAELSNLKRTDYSEQILEARAQELREQMYQTIEDHLATKPLEEVKRLLANAFSEAPAQAGPTQEQKDAAVEWLTTHSTAMPYSLALANLLAAREAALRAEIARLKYSTCDVCRKAVCEGTHEAGSAMQIISLRTDRDAAEARLSEARAEIAEWKQRYQKADIDSYWNLRSELSEARAEIARLIEKWPCGHTAAMGRDGNDECAACVQFRCIEEQGEEIAWLEQLTANLDAHIIGLEKSRLYAERERDEAMEKACAAIREACEPCGGKGYIGGGSRSDHDCGGDDSLCAMRCPIEVAIEPDECEYCGRPIAAIYAAFAAASKGDK